jgi:hypothetical protein
MTTIIKNADIRTIAAGLAVARATATLPATTAQNIFTVSGGRILLKYLVGEVTTIVQAQACTLKVTSTPTTGTAVDLSAASASISGAEVGAKFGLPAAAATGLVFGNAGGILTGLAQWVIPIGNISYTTSATNTGSIKWDLIYVPLENGAQVVAA